MGDFAVQFLISNIFISIITGMLFAARRILKKWMTSRMQYRLWFLLFGFLAVPFLPAVPLRFLQFFSWFQRFQTASASAFGTAANPDTVPGHMFASGWMNDFGVTISRNVPSKTGNILSVLWIAGILGMLLFLCRSSLRFYALKKSALPLQNPAVRRLYQGCLKEMQITKNIPIYSTAFLKSPVIAGILKPRIYLPIHLISDCNAKDIRYMLLHELTHYRHKDCLVNYFINTACVLYWFNPFVWLAVREMKTDREISCDTSVLNMLEADAYTEYGTTLINFAEKISHPLFPFAAGISGSMAQMKKRIQNIASYQKESCQKASFQKTLCSLAAYVLTAAVLSGFVPLLSTHAASQDRYAFEEYGKTISWPDLSASFENSGHYDGSFVLYDAKHDAWQIYNKEGALARTTPVSTYKIYSALLGLESGIISPEQTSIKWNGQHYAYDTWNADQTLSSAMQNSVNWYFQTIDRQAGFSAIKDYIQKTGYGYQTGMENLSSYWSDSSLIISPVEQVEMLLKFYYNLFDFSPENIQAVKDALYLDTSGNSRIYGKTGTGIENGRSILGWFIGYIEQDADTYFFAVNIQNGESASGTAAASLALSILSDLNIL